MQIAQTNIQLYNQLRDAHRPLEELVLVHRAYEFSITLYPGYYQADGKPFVAHTVGVASILASLDQPVDLVAAGLLHNIYTNADFGDGRRDCATPFRRRLVQEAVGEQVEDLIFRFRDLRIHPDSIADARRALPTRDRTERRLLLIELADYLEKHVDLGPLYYGDSDWIDGARNRIGDDLIDLADELGEPRLGEMLSTAFAKADAEARSAPPELRSSDGRPYAKPVIPRSYRRRLPLSLRKGVKEMRGRLRPRTRLRRLPGSAGNWLRAAARH